MVSVVPDCSDNLIKDPQHAKSLLELRKMMKDEMIRSEDTKLLPVFENRIQLMNESE